MIANSPELRVFTVIRHTDDTGISGIGRVIDGVIFHTGQVVICWRTDLKQEKNAFTSLTIYATWEAFEHIHINSHFPSQTEVIFGPSPDFQFHPGLQ